MASLKQKYTTIPILQSDLPTLATHILSTHLLQPPHQLLHPNWSFRMSELSSRYHEALRMDFEHQGIEMLKVVDGGGMIVATMVLIRRKRGKAPVVVGERELSASSGTSGTVEERWEGVIEDVERNMVDIEHLALVHISTIPTHRNQGLATSLLDLAKQRSRQAGLPLFISSPSSSHAFLLKNDFVTNSVVEVDLGEWCVTKTMTTLTVTSGEGTATGFGRFKMFGMLASAGFS